jgi:glycosyltransferase involved in cell wall biosynthesis
MTKKVSIIIPCYNHAHFLPDAIASALQQTYRNIEIIVVDDGSPDDVIAVTSRYPKVKLLVQKNAGLSAARNAGIKAATGHYILPLDADDKIAPEMIQRCIDHIDRYDIVCTWLRTFGHTDKLFPKKIQNPTHRQLMQQNQLNCCSLYTRDMWHRLGGYDEQMREGLEDWDFWLRATKAGYTVHIIPEYLFFYRKHAEGSMLTHALANKKRIFNTMLQKYSSTGQIIDVVYPLTRSRWNNQELRYSIRSLEQYCTGYRDIHVIGILPSWLQNTRYHPYFDKYAKAQNIMRKLIHAARCEEISDPFLYINDDHIFVKDTNVSQMPYLYGDPTHILSRPEEDPYRHTVLQTLRLYPGARYYDIHKPMLIYKEQMLRVAEQCPYMDHSRGLLVKTSYCDISNIIGTPSEDHVLRHPSTTEMITAMAAASADVISFNDQAINKPLQQWLATNYAQPSIYEKDKRIY